MESLEAKCKEVEFFRDTYSWEVDQLRDDLMDKEVEIDLLRKQQVHILPTSSSSSSSPVGKLVFEIVGMGLCCLWINYQSTNYYISRIQWRESEVRYIFCSCYILLYCCCLVMQCAISCYVMNIIHTVYQIQFTLH